VVRISDSKLVVRIHAGEPSKCPLWLNGAIILDADLDIVKDGHHPGLARPAGHIGFLGHGSLVEFRNIRVKELP